MYKLKYVKYKNILDIENLEIYPGKITCILGESGSGKTTLIKLLNKMVSHTSGTIYYQDFPLEKIDSVKLRREAVMMPQNPTIFQGDIKKNLLIGLKFSQKKIPDDEKLIKTLKMIHLNKSLSENSENLSGGEKQRLALGRVILMDPKALLLDEPSSALDENTEKNIIDEVANYVKEKNKTLIMVTHSQKIAQEYADDIIEIKKGKIVSVRRGRSHE